MSLSHTLYILAASIIIPSIVGLILYRKLLGPAKLVTLLLALGMLTESVMIYLSAKKVNNLFTVHFYAIVEIILLSLLFHKQATNKIVKLVIILSGTSLLAFAIIYASMGNNISEFNSLPRAIECLYFSLLSCWLFYEMADYTKPVHKSDYIFIGTIMFYFSSCFLIFAFNKYMIQATETLITMIVAHSLVNAFCNLAYTAGIWIASK